ncbi:hypothetical protein A5655_17355 [Mycobacterium sp. 1081908.1]|nr:hypothetical protein A5655_17355 [Mycobacterium sp. 1081908.1]
MRLVLAGAAALAMIALFDAARPETTPAAPGSVRLTDVAVSAPESGPFGGFAADADDDQAQQQAQLQEQLDLQQMQQSMQQAEQQNEAAQQQFLQDMQQAQTTEQQANNP